MADTDESFVQLATRIPKGLHHELKLHCVQVGTSAMDFVIAALKEKLASLRGGSSKIPPHSNAHKPQAASTRDQRARTVGTVARRKRRGTSSRRLRTRGVKTRTRRRSARRKAAVLNRRRKSSRSATRHSKTHTERLRRRGKKARRRLVVPVSGKALETLKDTSLPTDPNSTIAPESCTANALQKFGDASVVRGGAEPPLQHETTHENRSGAMEQAEVTVRLEDKDREITRLNEENIWLREDNTRVRTFLAVFFLALYHQPERDQATEPTERVPDLLAPHREVEVCNEAAPKPEPITAEQGVDAVTTTTPKKEEGGGSGEDA